MIFMWENIMNIDKRKWTDEYIENNIGKLSAQIIINQLIELNWNLWFIGNTEGNTLYTVDFSSGEKVIVGFTTEDIAGAHINKPEIKDGLHKTFGKKLVLVEFSLSKIHEIMQGNIQVVNKFLPGQLVQSFVPQPMKTIIVNPSGNNSFVPLNVPFLLESLLKEGEVEEGMGLTACSFSTYTMDKSSKRYIPVENEEEVL